MSPHARSEAEVEFLSHVIDVSPTPYFVKDADDDFRYVHCNVAYASLLGLSRRDIEGHRDEDLFGAEVAEKIRAHDKRVLAQEGPVVYEDVGPFHSKTGLLRVQRQKQMLRGDDGHRLVVCALLNLTEERWRTAAESFKATVSSYLVSTTDHNAFRAFIARQLLEYFGCQHVMLVDAAGRRHDWCSTDEIGQRSCRTCAACPLHTKVDICLGADDAVRIDDVSKFPELKLPPGCPNKSILSRVISFAGNVLGRLAVFYTDRPQKFLPAGDQVLRHAADVVALSYQRSRAYEELARKNRELMEERDRAVAAERAKSYFFSTVSHDIRTPLNAIIGFSQLLKLGVPDAAERAHVIDSIVVSGKTLLQLINDVLDLSKLEAGRMEILPDPTDCRRLVQEIVESFRAANTNRAVEVRGVTAPMPTLLLDAQRVRQILFNLVGNAMKFTQKGFVEVRAAYDPDARTLAFEVQDTGCGISEDDQQKIANPYVQVGEKSGRNGGTGLGLAICRQLVTAMNGEIELASRLGEGTTFYVTLKDVKNGEKARRERLSATQQMKVSIPAAISRDVQRVLLVDDSTMNLNVLKAMLMRFHVKGVETAGNGVEALAKMRAAPYDLVLTDLWMPEMDGEALVREIRRNPAWVDLPVYAVTADVEAQALALKAGFTDVLLKPLTFEKLKQLFA